MQRDAESRGEVFPASLSRCSHCEVHAYVLSFYISTLLSTMPHATTSPSSNPVFTYACSLQMITVPPLIRRVTHSSQICIKAPPTAKPSQASNKSSIQPTQYNLYSVLLIPPLLPSQPSIHHPPTAQTTHHASQTRNGSIGPCLVSPRLKIAAYS